MFGVDDNISIAGLNDFVRDHNVTYDKMLMICKQANLKLNEKQVPAQVYQHPILH